MLPPLAALALLAAPAAGQAPGLPLHGASLPSGVHVAATGAWSGASSFVGEAFTLGATVGVASQRAGLTLTGARVMPDWDSYPSTWGLGLLGMVRAVGGSLDVPLQVDLFGGYGWLDRPDAVPDGPAQGLGRGAWRVPVGAGFTLSITTPLASIRPWLAPRAEWFTEPGGPRNRTTSRLAGSAGVDLRFLNGLALRALWDQVGDDDHAVGVGAAWRF